MKLANGQSNSKNHQFRMVESGTVPVPKRNEYIQELGEKISFTFSFFKNFLSSFFFIVFQSENLKSQQSNNNERCLPLSNVALPETQKLV